MLSHITIGINDFSRAFVFYSDIMDELGFVLKFCDADKYWAGWMQDGVARPLLLIGRPFNGEVASPGNGSMVALLAANRSVVDLCHERAIANGGIDEGGPGLRPWYHANYYGAYFRDNEGNKLCVCCHDPVTDSASS